MLTSGNKRGTARTKLVHKRRAASRPASGQLSHSLKPHVSFIDFAPFQTAARVCMCCVQYMQNANSSPETCFKHIVQTRRRCTFVLTGCAHLALNGRGTLLSARKSPAIIIICVVLGFRNAPKCNFTF